MLILRLRLGALRMPYKQVFAHLYPQADRLLEECVSLLADGRLNIDCGAAEQIDIGLTESVSLSKVVMAGNRAYRRAFSPDGRYQLELDFYEHSGLTEYWLIHTDAATGRVRRAKLNTELPGLSLAAPRITIAPGGSYFIVDDSGVLRLYSTAHMADVGVFQVAFPNTENTVIALAATPDDRLIVALSMWKDIVLYDVGQRRVVFVRQIRDSLGWYDSQPAHILITQNAEAIVSLGVSDSTLSINIFQFLSLI